MMFSKKLLIIPIILLIIHVLIILFGLIPYANVLWDEGEFLLQTYYVSSAIQEGRITELPIVLYNQFQYPPLQSIILGIPLGLIGFSVTNARYISLMFPILSTLLLIFLSIIAGKSMKKTNNTFPYFVSIFSCFLFLSSPIILYNNSVILKETFCTTLILFSVLLYFQARKHHTPLFYILTGLSITLLFFSKYPNAIFLLLVFGLETLISLIKEKQKTKHLLYHSIIVLIPLVFGTIWVMFPEQRITEFIRLMKNDSFDQTGGRSLLTYILFYPKGIIYYYGYSIVTGWFLLIGFIGSILLTKKMEIRVLFLSFTIPFLLYAQHITNVQDRYLAPFFPFLCILVSIFYIWLWYKAWNFSSLTRWISIIMVGTFVAACIVTTPTFLLRVYNVGTKAILAIAFNQPDVNAAWFDYDTSTWGKTYPWNAKETPQDILQFITNHVDPSKPIYLKGRATEISPPYFYLMMNQYKHDEIKTMQKEQLPYTEYFITLEVLPTSRHYTEEYRRINEWVQWEAQSIKNDQSLTHIISKQFQDLGIHIGIYAR